MLNVLGYVLKPFSQDSTTEQSDLHQLRTDSQEMGEPADESPGHNYDNCIVTSHDDSDHSCTSLLSTPHYDTYETSQQPEDHDSYAEVTSEQVEGADLSPEDSFYFMVGMVFRVEKYLKNLEDSDPKEWLTSHIQMIKTALMKNLTFFQDGLKNNTTSPKEKAKKSATNSKQKKKAKTPRQSKTRLRGEFGRQTQEFKNADVNHSEGMEARSEARRSQRLQEHTQDRELVYCDRLSYISLKLPSSTPIPKIVKKRVNGKTVETKVLLNESPIKNNVTKRAKRSRTKTRKNLNRKEEVATATQKDESRMTGKKRSKRLLATTATSVTTDPKEAKKRRAVSLDSTRNKKAKKSHTVTEDSLPETSSANLSASNVSSGKRKLYTPDSWLHTLAVMQQLPASS